MNKCIQQQQEAFIVLNTNSKASVNRCRLCSCLFLCTGVLFQVQQKTPYCLQIKRYPIHACSACCFFLKVRSMNGMDKKKSCACMCVLFVQNNMHMIFLFGKRTVYTLATFFAFTSTTSANVSSTMVSEKSIATSTLPPFLKCTAVHT